MLLGKLYRTFVVFVLLLTAQRGGAQSAGLLREVWEGIEGNDLTALTTSPNFPDRPTSKNYVTNFFESPTDVLESYGQRMHGYVVAPLTGNYTFWVATDDQGALYLSTDDSPANARLIANVNGYAPPRQWEVESNQRSDAIRLTAGKAYYIAALMKEGGGGDNLAVRWLMPNGVDQAPIVATNLLPFGISFTPPVIARQPANTNAVEGTFARFSVGLSNVGPAAYSWRRNGTSLPDSNTPEFLFGPVRLSDQGARFSVFVTNSIGSTTSSEATLSVSPDITRPTVVDVLNIGTRMVRVTFSEPIGPPSATTATHYSIAPGITVSNARIGASAEIVELDTTALAPGSNYTLVINGVTDRAQTPNAIASNTQLPFTAIDYAPASVGTPTLAGSVRPAPGGATVTASGEIGGRSDAFQFGYQLVTGNFDRRVRVAAFNPTDPFAAAGLMARASLDANSAFAAAMATPGVVGAHLLSRATVGAASQRTGFFPVNYPQTWLRLSRAGSTFRAYAGFDGVSWTELGSVNVTLPTAVYFGFTASSRDPLRTTTVEFRDVGDVTGTPPANTLRAHRETPGPSSRLSPFVFSEIMYRPRARSDGRNTEFIEIHNADLIDQDLTDHRISGAIDFPFPAGFILPAGGFAVIARNPADLIAVYGLSGVLGPFEGTNNLPNTSGLLRLRNPQNAVLLEVEYDSQAPWPIAADGAGHSLVLSKPSYGEGNPRAWSASEAIGGSPGSLDLVRPNPLAPIVFNEILAHTDLPQVDLVELYNHGNDTLDLGGCFITDDPATNRFIIPAGTRITPRGFLAFTETQLGFRFSAAGESLFLISADPSRVLDAIRFGPQENGISTGRYPDGTPEWRRLNTVTVASENSPFRVSPVVINEILYNPISGDADDEFVELLNRSDAPVALSGWSFTDGIDFRFPTNTVIGPGAYIVVARNRSRVLANHPGLASASVFGNYAGSLANGGERLALAMPDLIIVTKEFGLTETTRIDIEVAEVTYGTGGRWGRWSDGLGSSLELIDPFSDALQPSNWADSDESTKAPWTTVEFTGRVDNVADSVSTSRIHLLAQGPGEYLIDNVQVFGTNGVNRVANGDFSNSQTGWTLQGNHRRSALAPGEGPDSSDALRVRATGRGDTAVNRIRAPIVPSLPANSIATLRARVRWVRGWPEFLLRTLGNGIEAHGRLQIPTHLGTPGARNSRAINNAGPAFVDVSHSPAVPRANEAVLVTTRVIDPDGVGTVSLRYRIDPNANQTTVPMLDDGSSGDSIAGDGIYSARIPGRASGTLIAFTVSATDRDTAAATAQFPQLVTFPSAATPEALIRWGEAKPFGNLGVYRFWQRQRDYNTLRSREPLANDPLDCTFVYGDERVIYNAEMRAKGSPWHGGSVGGDYVFSMPDDDRLLGAQDLAIVTLGNLGSDPSAQREQAAFWIGNKMGAASLHRRHIHFFENGGFKGLYEDTEEPNGLYADRWFPEGENGDLYKIEDWFEFDDSGGSFVFSRDATLQRFTTLDGALKQARYRWAWRKRAVQRSANDYSALLQLVETLANASTSTAPRIQALVDIENWMRTFALQHIVGNWDAYGHGRGKNSYAYLPTGGRWKILPWDIDFVLGLSSDGPTTDVFGSVDPVVSQLWTVPVFRRAYWRAFQDAVNGPLAPENIDALLDARYAALVANGFNVENPASIKDYVKQRRAYLTTRAASEDTLALTITSNNNGTDFSTANPSVTLTGRAPIAIQTLLVNGVAYPVTWTAITHWTLNIALSAATNQLVLSGIDFRGRPIPGLTDSVTIRYSGPPIDPTGFVVINEIMFDPPTNGAGFVEVLNTSSAGAFDLSGWSLSGVGYTFPPGIVLAPGALAVVAADLAAFRATYGTASVPVGEFPGSLQNNGERLRLVRPGVPPAADLVVDELRYEAQPPWPDAVGNGASLQLIDPRLDNRRPANWATAATNSPPLSTPGRANSVAATLPPFPNVWINEIQPSNISGATDQAGDPDPWVELHNPGDVPVDLGNLVLAVNSTQLSGWSFPSGTTLGPRQFLVVWCDGEPAESTPAELHASFRLNPTHGVVIVSRLLNGARAALDSLRYRDIPPDKSFGSFPDGNPLERSLFHRPTPGAPNTLAASPTLVFINEWMASNTGAFPDPADGENDDWFELYNAGNNPADLSAFTLTDTLADPAKFQIPVGTVIPPGGFLLVWADEEPDQTRPGQLHVNFKLSSNGEALALFAPDGSPVDRLTFGPQSDNLSQGRFPDGQPEPFIALDVPTPGEPNATSSANLPPVLAGLSNQTVEEGATITFTASASDPDPTQKLTFSLLGAPAAATLDPATGQFSWVTSETDGLGTYAFSVRVTDDGRPARSHTESVTLSVLEVNRPPLMDPIPHIKVKEGETLTFTVTAQDPDLPPQRLTYTLPAGSPPGSEIDPNTGVFNWTPTEAQGPGTYEVFFGVLDDATPQQGHGRFVLIAVTEIDNPPVFDPVSLQTVDELASLSVTLVAHDPDTPPKAITYRIETAPSGITIDADSGVLRWTPTEDDGPGSYPIIVRATEVGTNLTSTLTFSIVVNESNEPPLLSAIPDFDVMEDVLVRFTAEASDADRPIQRLTFRLGEGAPAEASVDPQTGVFSWSIPTDAGSSTNRITLVVTDNAINAQSASRIFTVVVRPVVRVVINEIQYAPVTPNTEFVELFNGSQSTALDLGGWRLTGLDFTFPDGTRLQPTNHLVVVRNRAAFQAAHGTAAQSVGNATLTFSNNGPQFVRFQRPASNGDWETVDEVSFLRDAPWPSSANGRGPSLQLIDAAQDNRRLANWSAVLGATTNAPVNVVTFTNAWRYTQDGAAPADWRGRTFNDAAWPAGHGLLYVEDAALPAPKGTALTRTEGRFTYYFRTRFSFAGNPAGANLGLNTVLDDGAVVHLNGLEIFRLGIDTLPTLDDTPASRTVSDATIEGPFTIPVTNLVAGENVLAVEVHQVNATSSDIVWGAAVDVLEIRRESATPGYANSVRALLPPFPDVWINEVLPFNTTGATDNAGDRDPWIELVHRGNLPADLTGWWLSDDPVNLTKWPFPSPAILSPNTFQLVWADAEPTEQTATAWHTSFRPSAPGGFIALVRPQNGVPAIVDYLAYDGASPNVSFGVLDPTETLVRGRLPSPTPGAENSTNRPPLLEPSAPREVIETQTLAFDIVASDPDAGQQLTWSLASGAPTGATLNPSTGRFTWTPTPVQRGAHNIGVSVTDNGIPPLETFGTFQVTVLADAEVVLRITAFALESPKEIRLTWTSVAGRRYQVESRATLSTPWTSVTEAIVASGPTTSAVAARPDGAEGYYRVTGVE